MPMFDVDYCVRRPLAHLPAAITEYGVFKVLSFANHPPPLLSHSTTLCAPRKGTANSRSGNVTAVVVAAVAEWKITCYACCVPFQTKFEETGFACERGHFYELRNRSLDGSFAPTHLGIARRENFTNSATAAAGHLGFRECFRRNAKTSMRNVLGSWESADFLFIDVEVFESDSS